ncbi:MAG: T9SS type A sorting domain-containing protein [Flavipsychrobacter sp.]|nr:T9SS type A sorting domain-containing protein [Flavipsychrobacter sp.]
MAFLKYITQSIIVSVSLLGVGHCLAQTPELTLKQKMFREVLKEKQLLHEGVGKEGNALQELTKTTNTDERLTTGNGSDQEAEVSVIYKPTDSSKLIISFMDQTTIGLTFPIYYSSNGGQTWTKSTFNTTTILQADFPGQTLDGGGDPAFAWDKNGRVYFSWIYLTSNATNDSSFFSLNWAYSDNNGVTWSVQPGKNHFIGQGAFDQSGNILNYFDGVTDREWLSVDNSGGAHQGRLYCSFVCFPANNASIFEGLKYKDANSNSFGPMSTVYNNASQFGNVEVDKNGIVNVSYADMSANEIRHSSSADGGATFSSSNLISSATDLMHQSGPFVIHNRENGAPNLAVDGAATLHIVWTDFVGGMTTSFYSRSSNGGITWSTPKTLDSFVTNKQSFMPTIAANGNNVAISFTGINYTFDTALYYQINSTNNGRTFNAAKLLSSSPTNYAYYLSNGGNSGNYFFGDYNRSVRSLCNTYAAWSDGRINLGPKIYFAKTNYCSIGIKEVTEVNATIQLSAVYPNPATDKITLEMVSTQTQNVSISLTNINGQKILTQKAVLHSGDQHIVIPLNKLPAGTYILSVNDNKTTIATRQVSIY